MMCGLVFSIVTSVVWMLVYFMIFFLRSLHARYVPEPTSRVRPVDSPRFGSPFIKRILTWKPKISISMSPSRQMGSPDTNQETMSTIFQFHARSPEMYHQVFPACPLCNT